MPSPSLTRGQAFCLRCNNPAAVQVSAGNPDSGRYRTALACRRHQVPVTRWASTAGPVTTRDLAGTATELTQLTLFDLPGGDQ